MNDSFTSTDAAPGPGSTALSARSWHWLLAATVVVITLSVFALVWQAEFVPWDDDINIYKNPHIQRGITAESLRWMFTDSSYVHRYMPIGWLALAIDVDLAKGLNPTTYHVGNLLLHALNAFLVFVLVGTLLRLAKPDTSPVAVSVAAALGALFWSIHPLRAESVAWSSARIYHVALLFALASVLAYVRAAERGPKRFYWFSIVLFLLSALTYPIVLGLPAAIVALDVFPLRRLTFSRSALLSSAGRRVWMEKVPFFAISALVLAATMWNRAHATRFMPAASLEEFGVAERLAQACYVWAAYLWKTCWPANLCPTYTDLLDFHWWQAPFTFSFLLIAGVTWLCLRRRAQWPAAPVLWAVYLALLFPMVGLTEHPHYAYDRYSLIVGVVLSLGVGAIILRLWPKPGARWKLLGGSIAALALCGILSFKQAGIWRNAHTLLPYMISQLGEHPARAKQAVVYGAILRVEDRLTEAEQYFRDALRVRPDYAEAYVHLSDVLADQNRLAEATVLYRRALQLEPNDIRAHQGLGVALGGLKQFDAAVAEFKQVLLLDTNNVHAMHNLAVTLNQMGEKELALNYYRRARSLRESDQQAH